MKIGNLRHRIIIQESTSVTSDSGQVTKGPWKTWKEVWAEVRGMKGRELLQAQQIKAESSHMVIIRYLDGVDTTHRVVWRGKFLDINSVSDPDGRHRELQLICKEAVN